MNSLLRNERPLYLCTRYLDENTGVTKFKKPIPIRINWQPINTDSQVIGLGVEYSKYIRIKATGCKISDFKNKDRVYVYVQPKIENFDDMCEDADYEVSGDNIITLNDGEVLLKRLSRGEEYE